MIMRKSLWKRLQTSSAITSVDDGLKSVTTESEAIDVIARSKDICAKGGLKLHKIVSS